jgi:hypothetical protein
VKDFDAEQIEQQTTAKLYSRHIAYMSGFFHGASDADLMRTGSMLPHPLIHMTHGTFGVPVPMIIRDIRAEQAKG